MVKWEMQGKDRGREEEEECNKKNAADLAVVEKLQNKLRQWVGSGLFSVVATEARGKRSQWANAEVAAVESERR
jgi:hypothetical protein